MAKKGVSLLLAVLLLTTLALPAAAEEAGQENKTPFELPGFDVPCRGALLMDQDTGTVLYEKEPDTPMPIASITKVMTLLLTFEALEMGKIHLEDKVPVSEHSYSMGGSQIWLEPGEEFTLDEMIKAICVSSANDAAVAVAEYVGGSEGAFVEMMNQKAQQLGLTNTHFANACGLDAQGHLSTARDVALLSREILLRYPQVTHYTSIWMDTLRGGQTHLLNTNKLLKRYQGTTGLKTGTTGGAGVCITASATRDGLSLIAVVLGSPSAKDRFDAAITLLDYGFANFESGTPQLPDTAPRQLPVQRGIQNQAKLEYQMPQKLLLKKGEGASLTVTTELPEKLDAPIHAGQQVGTVTVQSQGRQLGVYPIAVSQEVPRMNIGAAMHKLLWSLVEM